MELDALTQGWSEVSGVLFYLRMLFAGLKKVLILSSCISSLLPLSEVLAVGRMLLTLVTVVGAGWLEEVCRWGLQG